jgi:dihydroorotase
MQITLPKWYDLHVHLRQGPAMRAYIEAHAAMGCEGVLAMPNTKPPVAKVFAQDALPYWSIEAYRDMILKAGGDVFKVIIIPLYLTRDTTPSMIEAGAKAGLLQACKYYPPHGTTNADHGAPLEMLMENGVIAALERCGIVLCLHGEEHGLKGEAYFGRDGNAEDHFYRERMPRLRERFPELKIVCEHITTNTAVDFVKKSGLKTGATITPQHLLYTMGDLVQGLRYHLYCLPLVKFESDRQALLGAVNDAHNIQFFAGTDSAPHTTKATECGCAAGCFTGGLAPQLYVESFDLEKGQDAFRAFLCDNGPRFYGLPQPSGTFTLSHQEQAVKPLETGEGAIIPLPLGMGRSVLPWSITP